MIQIKDAISFFRFNPIAKDKNKVFGYYDRVLNKVIRRFWIDIESFNPDGVGTFNEENGRSVFIPYYRFRELAYVKGDSNRQPDLDIVWWRYPEDDIHNYGCTLK